MYGRESAGHRLTSATYQPADTIIVAAPTSNFQISNEDLYFVSPAISASGDVLLGAGPPYNDVYKYIYGRIGDVLRKTGQFQEAQRHYREYLRLTSELALRQNPLR